MSPMLAELLPWLARLKRSAANSVALRHADLVETAATHITRSIAIGACHAGTGDQEDCGGDCGEEIGGFHFLVPWRLVVCFEGRWCVKAYLNCKNRVVCVIMHIT